MARVTVEDCIERIPNRSELVLTASQRARAIQKGELLTIDRDNDKIRLLHSEKLQMKQLIWTRYSRRWCVLCSVSASSQRLASSLMRHI